MKSFYKVKTKDKISCNYEFMYLCIVIRILSVPVLVHQCLVHKFPVRHGPRMKADLNFTDTKIKNSTNSFKSHVIC